MNESCPSAEAIDALVGGRLPAAARREVEEHLERCSSCHQLVVRLLSALPEPGSDTGPSEDAGAMTGAHPTRGQRLGRYLILEDAGMGGMGMVFAAYDTRLDRKVALKFLNGFQPSWSALTRVLAEAGAMARLAHPNVVTVHDVGQLNGVPYLSMELVDGVTLLQWRMQRPRSFAEMARVMAAAARGLAAAHAAGIVHRDVKPQNILVAGSRVLVTDFGLSVPMHGDSASPSAGTPAYMSPEQFHGERVDSRTDVFGFCATLHHLLFGEPPFAGKSVAELRRQVMAGQVVAPPAGSRVPLHLARLARRGLDPDPARRPADLETVARELLADPLARWRRVAVGAGIAAAALAAFWGGGYLLANQERQCRAAAEVLTRSWNQRHRADLQRRYLDAGEHRLWPALESRLEGFTAGWRATYAETCAATFGRRVQSEVVFDLRVHCLQGQRATLETFMEALSSATPGQLGQASGAVLPVPGECALSRPYTRPLPEGADARRNLVRIDQAIARSLAEGWLGDDAAAAASARRAVEVARQLGYPPALAAALIRQADVQMWTAPPDEQSGGGAQTVSLLEQAYAAAEAGHDDPRRLAAACALVGIALRRGREVEAQMWLDLTEALLARLDGPALAESCSLRKKAASAEPRFDADLPQAVR